MKWCSWSEKRVYYTWTNEQMYLQFERPLSNCHWTWVGEVNQSVSLQDKCMVVILELVHLQPAISCLVLYWMMELYPALLLQWYRPSICHLYCNMWTRNSLWYPLLKFTSDALKVMFLNLLYWTMMSEVDVGFMAIKAKLFQQYSFVFCCWGILTKWCSHGSHMTYNSYVIEFFHVK